MDEVEATHAMKNMAMLVRIFYLELLEQKFSESNAIRLSEAYLRGIASGGAA